MKQRFLIIAGLILTFYLPGFGFPSDVLPFGSQVLRSYTDAEVQKLSREMCFNYFVEYDTIGPYCIDQLFDEGIVTIKGGILDWDNGLAEPPAMYSFSNYSLIDVGDDNPYPNPEVRMEAFGGSFSNGMWVSPDNSIDTLSGVSTYQSQFTGPKNRVAFYNRCPSTFLGYSLIPYRTDLLAAIDNPNPSSDTIVAIVTALVGQWNTCIMKPIHSDTIRVSDFGNNSTLQWILGKSDMTIPDTFTVIDWDNNWQCNQVKFYSNSTWRWNVFLRLDIATTGVREFQVDQVRISDPAGRELFSGAHDTDISNTFNNPQYRNRAEKIYAWLLMDEPAFTNLMPFAYIRAKLDSVYSIWVIHNYYRNKLLFRNIELKLNDNR